MLATPRCLLRSSAAAAIHRAAPSSSSSYTQSLFEDRQTEGRRRRRRHATRAGVSKANGTLTVVASLSCAPKEAIELLHETLTPPFESR